MPDSNDQNSPVLYIGGIEVGSINYNNVHDLYQPNEHDIESFRVWSPENDKAMIESFNIVLNALETTQYEASITSIVVEIKPNENNVLTFYIEGEPCGIVIDKKFNIVNDKPVYPLEFKILHNKGHLLMLRYEPDKISVESIPPEEKQ